MPTQDTFLQYWNTLTPEQQAQIGGLKLPSGMTTGGGNTYAQNLMDQGILRADGTYAPGYEWMTMAGGGGGPHNYEGDFYERLFAGAQPTVPTQPTQAPATTGTRGSIPSFAQWAATTAHPTQSGQTWADYWQTNEAPNMAQALALYNQATGQNLTMEQAGSRTLSSTPSGLTNYGRQNDEGPGAAEIFRDVSGRQFVKEMTQPQGDAGVLIAPDGTRYLDYETAKERGNAASAQGGGIFFGAGPSMESLPRTLAALVPTLGAGGVFGGLQGLDNGLFNLTNFFGGGNNNLLTAGGTDASWGVNPIGGTEAGADLGYVVDPITGDTVLSGGTPLGAGDLYGGGVLGAESGVAGAANPAGGVVTPPGGGTALSRILSGNGTPQDYIQVAGGLGSTALGVLGSNAQSDAYKDVAGQYLALGAPFRDKLLQSYQPGFNIWDDPTYKAGLDSSWDSMLRGLSAKGGNPFGNPGGLIQAQKDVTSSLGIPALSNYRGGLMQAGGFGLNTSGAASLQGAGESGGLYDSLGFGLSQLTQPQNSLQDLLRQIGGTNSYKLNLGGVGP